MAINYDPNNFDDFLLQRGMNRGDYQSLPLLEQPDIQREFELGRRVAQARQQQQSQVQQTPAVVPASASSIKEAMDQIKAGTFTGLKIDPNAPPTAFPTKPPKRNPPKQESKQNPKQKPTAADAAYARFTEKNSLPLVHPAPQGEPFSDIDAIYALGRTKITPTPPTTVQEVRKAVDSPKPTQQGLTYGTPKTLTQMLFGGEASPQPVKPVQAPMTVASPKTWSQVLFGE